MYDNEVAGELVKKPKDDGNVHPGLDQSKATSPKELSSLWAKTLRGLH